MPANDVLGIMLCRARDFACWAVIAILAFFAALSPFGTIAPLGVIVLIVAILAAMLASVAVLVWPLFRHVPKAS